MRQGILDGREHIELLDLGRPPAHCTKKNSTGPTLIAFFKLNVAETTQSTKVARAELKVAALFVRQDIPFNQVRCVSERLSGILHKV